MPNLIESMRQFVNGDISREELNEAYMTNPNDYEAKGYVAYKDDDWEKDECFMAECNEACLPTFLMMELMENAYDIDLDIMDEEVSDAFMKVHDYMVGQGLITETTMNINNPKVTFVKLSKKAQIQRLATIIALKMARKNKDPKYKKYKIAVRLKRAMKNDILSKHGKKAERIATKLWNQNKKNRKVNSVSANKKTEQKAKKK